MQRYFIAIVAVFTLVSCNTTPKAPAVETPPPVVDAPTKLPWDGKHKDAEKWTSILVEALEASHLPDCVTSDRAEVCPAYQEISRRERVLVLAHLIAKMAQFESSFDPSVKYTEDFKDAKGKLVVSRGLLQLSKESANAYGCKIEDEMMLHDAKVNLVCGVKILEKWIHQDGVFRGGFMKEDARGGARYWAVLRSQAKTKQGQWLPRPAYTSIFMHVGSLPMCKPK